MPRCAARAHVLLPHTCVCVLVCCMCAHVLQVAGTQGDAFQGVLAFVLDDGRIVVCDNDKTEEEKAEVGLVQECE